MDRQPGLANRQAQAGLTEHQGDGVELHLFVEEPVFHARVGRCRFGCQPEMVKLLMRDAEQRAKFVEIFAGGELRRSGGGDVGLLDMQQVPSHTLDIPMNMNGTTVVEFMRHDGVLS